MTSVLHGMCLLQTIIVDAGQNSNIEFRIISIKQPNYAWQASIHVLQPRLLPSM